MKAIRFAFPILCLGLAFYVCAFKVGNSDFWWHIKAGQLLRESGWISTDPFSYTRIGEAYLATHEWLAQVIMSIFYDTGGWAGVTLLRFILIAIAFGVSLQLHRKNYWINSALVVLALANARPALTDRPQLFTFALFSLVLFFCIGYLEENKKRRRGILIAIPALLIVWSNLHGAASLIGIAIFGALFAQEIFNKSNVRPLTLCLIMVLIAPFFAPGGFANISYLIDLFTEKSAGLIEEWKPGPWGWYIKHTGIFWLSGAVSIWFGRRNIIFSLLVLLGIGYLSRTAQRHEVLFIIAALTLTIYQLRYISRWNSTLESLQSKRILFPATLLVAIFCLGSYTHVRAYDINRNDTLYGFGVFEPMRGASNYLHSEHFGGNMFNNYNAGGELLFRDHQVFLDGRNIDYGYDYILRAVNAGMDRPLWDALDQEYNFMSAVIYYAPQAQMDPLPYTDLLDEHPDWALVYLDDWAAVYRKISSGDQISTITPKTLETQQLPEEMGQQYFQQMQEELNSMIRIRPDGVKPRLYLAKLYTAVQAYDEAEVLLGEAMAVQPQNFSIYLGLMKLRMEQGRWDEAWKYLKTAKSKAGYSGLSINEDLVEQIRAKAKGE